MKQELTITVPKDWSAVTLNQYLELRKDMLSYEGDEEALTACLFHHLCKFPLEYLQQLDLENNQFSSLPAEIGRLINLQYLHLNNNKLSNLPAEIGRLINLQQLYLYNNQLSSLPAEIGNLINLQYLSLYNNQLSSLPVEILAIKKKVIIDESSYDINNLDIECNFLIFSKLNIKITNLPINLDEIWLNKDIIEYNIKLPFNCKIINF